MFIKLYAALAVVLDASICFICSVLDDPLDFWKPIVLFGGLFFGLFVLHFLVLIIISLFINKKKPCEKPNAIIKFLLDYTVEAVLSMAGVKIIATGVEKLPLDRRFLMVSNHRSNLDPFILIDIFKKNGLAFVSKPENFKIPVAGAICHKCCYLPIDRENARNAMKTIHKATDFVKKDICSVGIYPEGTRSKTGELLPFKDGVFYISKKAPCPIVVLTVKNTEKIGKNFPFRRTKVYLDVLDVIYPEDFCDKTTHEISEYTRDLMFKNLNK